MRVVIVCLDWESAGSEATAAVKVGELARESWLAAAPHLDVVAFALGDGGPLSAAQFQGQRRRVGGIEVVDVAAGKSQIISILAPAERESRWNPLDLSAGLLGLADEARSAGLRRRVVVPVGDLDPAGDATRVWGAARPGTQELLDLRGALDSLDIVVLTSTDRPLLGFHGMSSALRDGREADTAVAVAAQRQEERWTAIARAVDPHVARTTLIGSARLSDAAGTGAAQGLAYCLAAAGGRIVTDATGYLADLSGVHDAFDAEVAVAVAIAPTLTPTSLDHGIASSLARAAAHLAIPAIAVAPEVLVGKRDLMAAGLAAAYAAGSGLDALTHQIRRVAQTWTPSR